MPTPFVKGLGSPCRSTAHTHVKSSVWCWFWTGSVPSTYSSLITITYLEPRYLVDADFSVPFKFELVCPLLQNPAEIYLGNAFQLYINWRENFSFAESSSYSKTLFLSTHVGKFIIFSTKGMHILVKFTPSTFIIATKKKSLKNYVLCLLALFRKNSWPLYIGGRIQSTSQILINSNISGWFWVST